MELVKNIMQFFRALTPSFERSRIISEIRGTLKGMRDYTIKTISMITDDIAADSKLRENVLKVLRKAGYSGYSPSEGMVEIMTKLLRNEEKIVEMIEKTFNSYVMKEALDYEKLNILHYTNAIAFFDKFTRNYALSVIALEKKDLGAKLNGIEKLAIEFCHDKHNLESYEICSRVAMMDIKHIVKILRELKGIQITDNLNERSIGLRSGATDPFSVGFLPVSLNPAYYIGLAYNEWKAYDYESAKVEMEKVELELMFLAEGDKTDPQITQQIKYYNGLLAKLQAKIEDIEEDI